MENEKKECYRADCEKIKTPFPKIKATCLSVNGDCYHNYQKGDELVLADFTHPPKHFCLGLAHAFFPVAYALSFGAQFPFMENQKSLRVTCPDGGKAEFLVELLNDQENTEFIPKDPKHKGPNPKKMELEVIQAKGKCVYGYKKGDKWQVEGLKCIGGFCGAAWHTAFPALFALNFGADFSCVSKPDSLDTITCPDGGNIVFKARRKKEQDEKSE